MKMFADIFLVCAASILVLGASYLWMRYQAYAIAGCFLVAAVMLAVCYVLSKKK